MKNARWESSFLMKFHASSLQLIKKWTLSQDYFKGFTKVLHGCFQALVSSELLLQILLVWKQPLEIMVKSWKISLFLNLTKLKASNRHLLKMDSIRIFSRISSKFYTIRYDLLEFSEHLFMAIFIRFGSTCFSKHLRVAAAFFIKQPCYFFLKNFLFKESAKQSRTFILTSWWNKIPLLFLITFSWNWPEHIRKESDSPFAKKSNFSSFYCISIAVTNIILYVVWHLEHGGSYYIISNWRYIITFWGFLGKI